MASSESNQDDLQAARQAISTFDRLNAEAARILGALHEPSADSLQNESVAGEDATTLTLTGTQETGEIDDSDSDSVSCSSDVSDIVNSVLAAASKDVTNLSLEVKGECNTVTERPDDFSSSKIEFPPIEDKFTSPEVSLKFELQKLENNMVVEKADSAMSSATDLQSLASSDDFPSYDELLSRFQVLGRIPEEPAEELQDGPAASGDHEGPALLEGSEEKGVGELDKGIEEQSDELRNNDLPDDVKDSSTSVNKVPSEASSAPSEQMDIFSHAKMYHGYIDVDESLSYASTDTASGDESPEADGAQEEKFTETAETIAADVPADEARKESPAVLKKGDDAFATETPEEKDEGPLERNERVELGEGASDGSALGSGTKETLDELFTVGVSDPDYLKDEVKADEESSAKSESREESEAGVADEVPSIASSDSDDSTERRIQESYDYFMYLKDDIQDYVPPSEKVGKKNNLNKSTESELDTAPFEETVVGEDNEVVPSDEREGDGYERKEPNEFDDDKDKLNVDVKSSLDTSVWSASEDEIPEFKTPRSPRDSQGASPVVAQEDLSPDMPEFDKESSRKEGEELQNGRDTLDEEFDFCETEADSECKLPEESTANEFGLSIRDGLAQPTGVANIKSMFDVPSPRLTADDLYGDGTPTDEVPDLPDAVDKVVPDKSESPHTDASPAEVEGALERTEDIPERVGESHETEAREGDKTLDTAEQDANEKPAEAGQSRPKSGKPRRRGSIGKDQDQNQKDDDSSRKIRRRGGMRRRRSKTKMSASDLEAKKAELEGLEVAEVADKGQRLDGAEIVGFEEAEIARTEEVQDEQVEQEDEGVTVERIPDEVAVVDKAETEVVEKRRRRRRRKRSVGTAEVKEVSVQRSPTPVEREGEEMGTKERRNIEEQSQDDNDFENKEDTTTPQSSMQDFEQPHQDNDLEANVELEDETVNEEESLRHSRMRHRKVRAPKMSDTLYQQRPFTNDDMLDEKYVELFEIMKSDGIEPRKLVREVGVVLARAGLSPRSPRSSPRPSPRTSKTKSKTDVASVPGVSAKSDVHVIRYDTNEELLHDSKRPVPAQRTSINRAKSRETNSFERTQKKLYRKYNELNSLLNRQLPDEPSDIVQEQLQQTLQLLHRHHREGQVNRIREQNSIGQQNGSTEDTQHAPLQRRSIKSVSFGEARPNSSRRGRQRIDASKLITKQESDESGSESPSRSRSRSFSPTDCNLRNSKNPEIRSWLRTKNRERRKERRAERLKELEEQRKEEEHKKEEEEKAKESRQRVQEWFRNKYKEKRLLSKREEESAVMIGKVENNKVPVDAGTHSDCKDVPEKCTCGFADAEANGAEKKVHLENEGLPARSLYKRPATAPEARVGASRRKPLADNVKTSGSSNVKDLDDPVAEGNKEVPKRPKSAKRKKKKENISISEEELLRTEMLKKRMSYEQWLKEKRVQDKEAKKREKKEMEKRLSESDKLLDTIVPDMARRRIRIIESNKKRVDSGVHRIDSDANSYPRPHSTSSILDPSAMSGENVSDAEERYQWKLEGEVSRRPKSGKPRSRGWADGQSSPPSPRKSRSPVSKTRARARLTMPRSAPSPRSRVENISADGPNPFQTPIPVVNASLKRSGDARSEYAKEIWVDFSDGVWKQVNEEEGVDLMAGKQGGDANGQTSHSPPLADGSAIPLPFDGQGHSYPFQAKFEAKKQKSKDSADSSEQPKVKGSSDSSKQSEVKGSNDNSKQSKVKDTNDSSKDDEPDTENEVNFGGVVYSVEEETKDDNNNSSVKTPEKGVLKEENVAKEGELKPKKKVNFGGIVYTIDDVKKEEKSSEDSEIEEDMPEDIEGDESDGDDDVGDSFFLTSMD